MTALTPAAAQLLHHLTHHDTDVRIHYLTRDTWLVGDEYTAPDTALTALHTVGYIEYRPGLYGGTSVHVTPAGHAATLTQPAV
ncbi:hypothetical protein [Streptomyces sp. NPDC093060]|uniref:hypothetical protein n=1 Tax=Streptomyces sp. NPDC093060 TaxID=3366019 RepID=UPI00381BACCD